MRLKNIIFISFSFYLVAGVNAIAFAAPQIPTGLCINNTSCSSSVNTTTPPANSYFVKPDGDNNADGKSHETAWKTVNKVNNFNFNEGDDVYFLAGGTWVKQPLAVDWPGSENDRVVIGAYHMNSGKETVGVPRGVDKPTITGGYTSSKDIGNVPTSTYRGLIWLSKSGYVTVQNMKVKDSSGYGITMSGGGDHNIIENNEVVHTVGASFATWPGNDYVIFRNNTAIQSTWSIEDGIKPVEYGSHPPCLGIKDSKYALVENNTLHQLRCEGIALVENAIESVIRGNTVTSGKYVGIYINGTNNSVVENNLILGDGSGKAVRMSGISVSVENLTKEHDSINNIIRNNLIAGVTNCFSTWLHQPAKDEGRVTGGEFIGNSCVGVDNAIAFASSARHFDTWLIANNLIWDSGGEDACSAPLDNDITFSHNAWEVNPKDSDCDGIGDIHGDPFLTTTSDFRYFGKDNLATAKDFTPQIGSPVINAGKVLENLKTDYQTRARQNPPSIGAIELAGEAP